MANPNIVQLTSMFGVTSAVMLSAAAAGTAIIVQNPANSDSVYKINALYASNIGVSANLLNVEFNRPGTVPGSPNFFILRNVSIPAQSTLDVLSKNIYLQENDSLRGSSLSADGGAGIEVVCSFEIIK